MKSFKDIRSQINEEYYNGPTAYVGGDRSNVGDIAGSDLGSLANGGKDKPYATANDMKVLEKAFNQELHGTHRDPVLAITKAVTKFSSTGLVFELNNNDILNSAKSGETYVRELTFGGQPLGDGEQSAFKKTNIGFVDQPRYEETLPSTDVQISFEPVGLGYKITAEFV